MSPQLGACLNQQPSQTAAAPTLQRDGHALFGKCRGTTWATAAGICDATASPRRACTAVSDLHNCDSADSGRYVPAETSEHCQDVNLHIRAEPHT